MDRQTVSLLQAYADRYESSSFLEGDPSWFMHQVSGAANQETLALLASCLSYGSRKQFMPKIRQLLDASCGEPYEWVRSGAFIGQIPDDPTCFYRLYTHHTMHVFLQALRSLLIRWHTIGHYAAHAVEHGDHRQGEALRVLMALNDHFAAYGLKGIMPQPVSSLCKRPCMFLRWMVRDGSPVDLGLWADRIDRRSLLIPVDTHVIQTARRLGLIQSTTASWATVVSLSRQMLEVFPDDPARGDFALYGADVFDTK